MELEKLFIIRGIIIDTEIDKSIEIAMTDIKPGEIASIVESYKDKMVQLVITKKPTEQELQKAKQLTEENKGIQ